jgi:hypothetical protein
MMLGYTLGGYLIARTNFSLDVGDNDERCHDKSPRYGRRRRTISTRHMDESGQGPKRAVAEAAVHLLKIQPGIHTVPKTRQISEKIREEVPWRENFPVIRGNDTTFLELLGNFPYRGLPPLYLRKSARFSGQCTALKIPLPGASC